MDTENSSFSPTAASPRISFSHNLDNSLIESYPYRAISSPDFDFCFTSQPIENEPSSADELFSNGLIRLNSSSLKHVPEERSKQIVSDEGNQSKSFWRIKRSSSLQSESMKQKTSFWSSLPRLSRSNSTGSVIKDRQNRHNSSQKQSNKNSSMAVFGNRNSYSSMKPPLKRNYDYGIRVSPVLNVPPLANLLGLGSFFQKSKK